MASAEQLKALLRSHIDGDDNRFYSVAMQLAAHEAKIGHGQLALELRDLVDEAKRRRALGSTVPISRPRGELAGLLSASYPKSRLPDMVLGQELSAQVRQVILEQKNAERILRHGLSPRRKLLLIGPPGTGKTMTASVLAGELGIPLFQVRLDGLITKFMGETAAKLRQVFDATGQTRGVYFFDEFDAIGAQRGSPSDVGEIRRVLNSFLQMIEQDNSHSLIVAATNHAQILDEALFRRFDDVLHYDLPRSDEIASFIRTRLARRVKGRLAWQALGKSASGLSFADVSRVVEEVIKKALIFDKQSIEASDVREALQARRRASERMRGGRNK